MKGRMKTPQEQLDARDAARAAVKPHQRGVAPFIPFGGNHYLEDRLPEEECLTRFGCVDLCRLADDIGWARIEVPVYFNGSKPAGDVWAIGGATAQRCPEQQDQVSVLVIFAPGALADDVYRQLAAAGPGLGAASLVVEDGEVVAVSLNVGEARLLAGAPLSS